MYTPTKQYGFTLIELLIALGIMAIFSLLAYRGLDSVLRLHQSAYVHQQQAQALDRTLTQLEADLRQASHVQAQLVSSAPETVQIIIERWLDGQLITIIWQMKQGQLLRQSQSQSQSQSIIANNINPIQVAKMLSEVSKIEWLSFNNLQNNNNNNINNINNININTTDLKQNWQPIINLIINKLSINQSINQSINNINKITLNNQALGLRITIAGKSVEKYFLIGR